MQLMPSLRMTNCLLNVIFIPATTTSFDEMDHCLTSHDRPGGVRYGSELQDRVSAESEIRKQLKHVHGSGRQRLEMDA